MNQKNRLIVAALVVLAAFLGFTPAGLAALPFFIGETFTTSDADELMKVVFDDTVIPEAVLESEFLDIWPKGKVISGPDGRYFETSQLHTFGGSIGSRSEGGYIPVPANAAADNSRVNLKKIMGSIEASNETLKKVRKSKAAFLTWAKDVFPQFRSMVADDMDRQALGAGTGLRARVNDASPATTLVVDSALGIAGYDNALMHFRRGMFLRASANADGSSPRTGVMQVQQLDWANEAIIVDALATSIANNDYLFEGDAADNSAGKDMTGALGLIDDGGILSTLFNIDRSTQLYWQSYVHDVQTVHGSGTGISEDVLIEADRRARRQGGGKISHLIMSETGFLQVWADLKADRSLNDPRAYTGGVKGIDIWFGGTKKVNIRTARKLSSRLAFGVQADQLRKFVLHEWEWDDTTGSIWKQVIDTTGRKDVFFAYGSGYGELGIKSPQSCWRAENWA